jgi:hypothetical protein
MYSLLSFNDCLPFFLHQTFAAACCDPEYQRNGNRCSRERKHIALVVFSFLEIGSELVHWHFRLDALSRRLLDVSFGAIGNTCSLYIEKTFTASFACVID